jgi:hypothetical protein
MLIMMADLFFIKTITLTRFQPDVSAELSMTGLV